jgi:hypothetical protein
MHMCRDAERKAGLRQTLLELFTAAPGHHIKANET